MALTDFELISRAITITLNQADELQRKVIEERQESATTSSVNTLRSITMQYSILCVGAVSVFEALLQTTMKWREAFKELDAHLRTNGMDDLAARFKDYRDAINVLKHGEGRSYERLLARRHYLSFIVKDRGQPFFFEGDVSEVQRLVDANPDFARQCSNMIEEVVLALRTTTGNVFL